MAFALCFNYGVEDDARAILLCNTYYDLNYVFIYHDGIRLSVFHITKKRRYHIITCLCGNIHTTGG